MDGTEIRAGLIKAGASYHRVTPFEATVLEAAAAAHARTGAPIGVHTQHGTHGLAAGRAARRPRASRRAR